MKQNFIFLILFILIIIFWVISPWLLPKIFVDINSTDFEKIFNGVNSLFSGLAFLGVIYTVVLQRQELKLQREELVLTREELKRSAKAQEDSERALSAQVKMLSIAARINGLTTMIEFNYKQMSRSVDLGFNFQCQENIKQYGIEIDNLLHALNFESEAM